MLRSLFCLCLNPTTPLMFRSSLSNVCGSKKRSLKQLVGERIAKKITNCGPQGLPLLTMPK